MKKSSLQDLKKKNRQVILNTILNGGPMSRTELAEKTRLSPSTVSGLVSGLLESGLLVETGVTISTGGRSRIELAINGSYGDIVVVEIGRGGANMHLYDMGLGTHRRVCLSNRYISGNELLIAITAAVFDHCGGEKIREGRLVGMGLLFQEDMRASEFNVMYSTSLSSANISLREALMTQFRIPIREEYSQVYSFRTALGEAAATPAKNSMHLTLGERVFASIALEGNPVDLRDGARADITPLLCGLVADLPALADGEAQSIIRQKASTALTEPRNPLAALAKQVAAVIATLCMLFDFDSVLLSGAPARVSGFAEAVSAIVTRKLAPLKPPAIRPVEPEPHGAAQAMALKIRDTILCLG